MRARIGASGSAVFELQNTLRFHFDIENIANIPEERYQEAVDLVDTWEKRTFNEFMPLLKELQTEWIHHHLCRAAPFTAYLKKTWKKKFKALLPRPLNWKQIASQLEIAP